MRVAVWVGVSWLVAGCPRPPPPPPPLPPPPPPIAVPEGCLADLSGAWVHADDPSFRYLATDDGGALELVATRTPVVDAGFRPRRFRPSAEDAGAVDAGIASADDAGLDVPVVRITLARTPQGFVGATLSPMPHPQGRTCVASFATELLDCRDGGLLISAASATSLGDACQPPATPLPAPVLQHRLVRP